MSKFIDEFNARVNDCSLIKSNYDDDGIVMLKVTGSISTYNSSALNTAIIGHLADSKKKILILDLQNVNYISSTGVGVLTYLYKHCINDEVNLLLYKTNYQVKKIVDLLGFAPFFTFIDNIENAEAVDALEG